MHANIFTHPKALMCNVVTSNLTIILCDHYEIFNRKTIWRYTKTCPMRTVVWATSYAGMSWPNPAYPAHRLCLHIPVNKIGPVHGVLTRTPCGKDQ
jgi:hypothetical protein